MADYVAVPLDFRKELQALYVTGVVDGVGATFLVDTGSTNCILDRAFAVKLGIKLSPLGAETISGEQPVQSDRADIKSFRLGDVSRESGMLFSVIDLSATIAKHSRQDGVTFHGILGGNLLSASSAVIDYRGRVLYIHDPLGYDRRRLQGEWVSTLFESAGKEEADKRYAPDGKISMKGDEVKLTIDDDKYVGKINLGVNRSPRLYCLSDMTKNGARLTGNMYGLYSVEGDTLRFMFPVTKPIKSEVDVPKALKTTTENGMGLFTFKRVPAKAGAK